MRSGVIEAEAPETPLSFEDCTPVELRRRLDVCARHGLMRFLALFRPSFHAEVLVAISLGPGRGFLMVSSFDASFCDALNGVGYVEPTPKERLLHKYRGHPLPGMRLPSVSWTEAKLELGRREVAVRELPRLFERAAAFTRVERGLDGISLTGYSDTPSDSTNSFEAWSPPPGTPRHDFFVYMYELAPNQASSKRLL